MSRAFGLDDDVVDVDWLFGNLQLGPGFTLVPRVSNLSGGLNIGSSNEKGTVVAELVDQRNLGDLGPCESSISRLECSLSCSSIEVKLVTNVSNSHDNTDSRLLRVWWCETLVVVGVHLKME